MLASLTNGKNWAYENWGEGNGGIIVRAGACQPCVETELTATKKSATDGN